MSNILLFEPRKDQVRRLIFLLRLAGHECTVAYTTDEAVNWLRSDKYLLARFDLLLLGSVAERAVLILLLDEIRRQRSIPVVCLQRKSDEQPGELPAGISWCQPEDLISTLNDCLAVKEDFRDQTFS